MEDFLHERGRLCEKPFTHLYKALLPKKYLVSKQKVSKKRVTPVPGNRKKIGSSAKKKLAENATSLNFAHFFCFLDICFKTQSLLSVRNTRAVSLRVFLKKPEIWNVWFVKKYLVSKHNKVSSQSETTWVCLRCRRQIPLLGVALLHENETMRGKF